MTRTPSSSASWSQAGRAVRSLVAVVAIAQVFTGTLTHFADESRPLTGSQATRGADSVSPDDGGKPADLPCMTADSRARYAMVNVGCGGKR